MFGSDTARRFVSHRVMWRPRSIALCHSRIWKVLICFLPWTALSLKSVRFLQPTFKVNTPLYISPTCKETEKKEKEIPVIADAESRRALCGGGQAARRVYYLMDLKHCWWGTGGCGSLGQRLQRSHFCLCFCHTMLSTLSFTRGNDAGLRSYTSKMCWRGLFKGILFQKETYWQKHTWDGP